MITITDDFLTKEHYNRLNNAVLEYGKVHFVGYDSTPKNALHELVSKIHEIIDYKVIGSTAWYNIRPINPQWHDDISSYCTQNGVNYEPKNNKPPFTFLYYMRQSDTGGRLEFENGDMITAPVNRMIRFSANLRHKVEEYTGNRVSIGMIPWPELPDKVYGKVSSKEIKIMDRVWEIEDNKS